MKKKLARQSDRLNVFDFIDKDDPLMLDDCMALAKAMVLRTGNEPEPHWLDSAEAWIAASSVVVAIYGDKENGTRSLQAVAEILTNPLKLDQAIRIMIQTGGMLARLGGQLQHFQDRERASTLSSATRFMRFLNTPLVMENTQDSTFDPAELRHGKMTVYLVLPPEFMKTQSPLLRLWIGALMRACVRGGLES